VYKGVPRITRCVFVGNWANENGGAVSVILGSPRVIDCTFVDNEALQGGGVSTYIGKPIIEGCSFINNEVSGNGGGVFLAAGVANILNCTFIGNQSYGNGGGLESIGTNRIIRCTFRDNYSRISGGGAFANCNTSIADCVFWANTVHPQEGHGGGLMIFSFDKVTVTNSLFFLNSARIGGGAGVGHMAQVSFINCTFARNKGVVGGAFAAEDNDKVILRNSILAFSLSGKAVDGLDNPGIDIAHCNVYGNAGGDWVGLIQGQQGINGNIGADPKFVNAQAGDCHLTYPSPCRDAGDETLPELPDHDLDLNPRVVHGFVDMGADEFCSHLYFTGDPIPGGTVNVKLVGVPDTTPVILWIGSGLLDPPLYIPEYGYWHLEFPLLFDQGLGLMPGPHGVLDISYTFDPGFPPRVLPMQALIGQDLTDPCLMDVKW